jgi:flagellin
MPQFINTNVMSLNTVRVLDQSQKSLQTSMERLSSGKRINHARDDAAGMAITEGMTSQINGMNQAVRNSNDGISMVQTADGAMEGIASKLQRMRELAVQAANGIYSVGDRGALDIEFQALDDEINRVAENTEFNGISLLAADLTKKIQTGAKAGSTIEVSLTGVTSSDLNIAANTITTQNNASTSIDAIDAALSTVNSARAKLGATQNRLETTVQDLKNNVENLSASRSRIKDADFASETATLAKNQILQQAGMAMLSQANQLPQQVLKLLQ